MFKCGWDREMTNKKMAAPRELGLHKTMDFLRFLSLSLHKKKL